MYLFIFSGLAIALSMTLASCSKSNFASDSNTSDIQGASESTGEQTNDAIAADNGSWVERFAVDESVNSSTDIVFAVDTSGSMEDEITAIELNIASFVKSLEQNKLDFTIAAIGNGNDFDFPQDPRIKVVPEEIDSHDAIGILSSYLMGPNAVRADSHLNVIVVTDDNGEGSGNLAGDFKAPVGITSLKVHAVVGLVEGQDPNNEDCNIRSVGTEYQNLAKSSKGLIQNICINDWSKLIANLSQSIVQSTQRAFPLEKTIETGQAITVKINDIVLSEVVDGVSQYSYDAQLNTLFVSNEVKLAKTDIVSIQYFAK